MTEYPHGDPVEDPALRDVADLVQRALHADPRSVEATAPSPQPVDDADREPAEFDPSARAALRERLVAARDELNAQRVAELPVSTGSDALGTGSDELAPRRSARRRAALGLVAAAAAAVIVGGVVVQQTGLGRGPSPVDVVASGGLLGAVSADPSAPLQLRFSPSLDHETAVAALRLSPAAAVRTSWQGDQLTVTPVHGFAADAAYVVTIDRTLARTAAGGRLASDVRVAFGTAPQLSPLPAPGAPLTLDRSTVAGASDGSEAVITDTGAVLLTSAERSPGTRNHEGLVRVDGAAVTKLAPATDAICVSRSGQSIAFLSRSTAGSRIVIADGAGNPLSDVAVPADPATPLGWIGDSEVSFVSGGRLSAVDRTGRVRVVTDTPVDAAHDDLAIAPGGRFVYLASPSTPGRVIDLVSGRSHELPGVTGTPAFSADGASVVWLQGSGATTRLASAPSGGGPVLSVPLPVADGDTVSDLSVSPGGTRLVYSVTAANGAAQLRLASLPDAVTLAVSQTGVGQSPNWAPSGDRFAVLSSDATGGQIQVVDVPAATDATAAARSLAAAFANAQISQDGDALAALSAPGTTLPTTGSFTRARVLWVQQTGDDTFTARLRLTVDATASEPVVRQAEETVAIRVPAAKAVPVVTDAQLGPPAPVPGGPAVTGVDTGSLPGAVVVTFDSDLDPESVVGAVTLLGASGSRVEASVQYDAGRRTVTVRPSPASTSPTTYTLTIATDLKDIAGNRSAAALSLPVRTGPA